MVIGAISKLTDNLSSLVTSPWQGQNPAADFAALLKEKTHSSEQKEPGKESPAELLRALGNQSTVNPELLKAGGKKTEEPGSLNELRDKNQELRETFQARLRNLLQENGISPETALEIRTDLAGAPVVDTPHEQYAEIDELVKSDPELLNLFHQLSANESLLNAAAEHTDFARAYAADPEEAVRLFAHLFQPQGFSEFGLSYRNGVVEQLSSTKPVE
ncbi:MAG: hypothetical protein R3C11_29185 [Planctomycetaceae bacterium]